MSEESELEARAIRVSNFLVKKDKASALAACLQNPPVNEKTERSEELKVPARRNSFQKRLTDPWRAFYTGEKSGDS
jgi:hypothetical protein